LINHRVSIGNEISEENKKRGLVPPEVDAALRNVDPQYAPHLPVALRQLCLERAVAGVAIEVMVAVPAQNGTFEPSIYTPTEVGKYERTTTQKKETAKDTK
jgi:hypothetical protein